MYIIDHRGGRPAISGPEYGVLLGVRLMFPVGTIVGTMCAAELAYSERILSSCLFKLLYAVSGCVDSIFLQKGTGLSNREPKH